MRQALYALSLLTVNCDRSDVGQTVANADSAANKFESPAVAATAASADRDALAQKIGMALSELNLKVEMMRSKYQPQTSDQEELWYAHMRSNLRLYQAGGAGMALRLDDEEQQRFIKTAGLNAEKDILEAIVPITQAGKTLLQHLQTSERDANFDSMYAKFNKQVGQFSAYVRDHEQISFRTPGQTAAVEPDPEAERRDDELRAAWQNYGNAGLGRDEPPEEIGSDNVTAIPQE